MPNLAWKFMVKKVGLTWYIFNYIVYVDCNMLPAYKKDFME